MFSKCELLLSGYSLGSCCLFNKQPWVIQLQKIPGPHFEDFSFTGTQMSLHQVQSTPFLLLKSKE